MLLDFAYANLILCLFKDDEKKKTIHAEKNEGNCLKSSKSWKNDCQVLGRNIQILKGFDLAKLDNIKFAYCQQLDRLALLVKVLILTNF